MDNKHTQYGALEALLFQYGEALSFGKIARILGIKESACKELVDAYKTKLQTEDRGLTVLTDENNVRLVTKPDFQEIQEHIVREEFRESLTPAAGEVLSIIAYLGPITRAQIEFIRGVNSSFILRTLTMRGLVERTKEQRGYTYQVTFDFLTHLGLDSVTSLPEYDTYHNLLEQFELSATPSSDES